MKNGKQPIAPSLWAKFGDGADDYKPTRDDAKNGYEIKFGGLTKREHFASLAMQGLLTIYDSSEISPIYPNEGNVKYMAKLAIVAADALLEELEKPTIQK